MFQFDLPKGKSSILKVIGVGGGGGNAVNYMYNQNNEGVDFIICNTDSQALECSNIPNKIQLGPNLTQGLGAGANPMIGKEATQESIDEIKQILEVNTKMAFITAGMGGGTGTGGAPIVAEICKELGILTVGIVTTPFSYEGFKRKKQANEGIKELKNHVDTLLVISNDKLRHQFGNLTMSQAFSKADNVLATAAKCITDVINSTGQINVDFADVSTVMRNGGVAILGNAECGGEDRAQQAIEEAVNSPLLNDNDISGARWILININSAQGEHEFTMDEVDTIQTYLLSKAGEGTDVIMGLGFDDSLEDKIAITLIATGFEDEETRSEKVKSQPVEEKPKKEVLELKVDSKEGEKKAKSQPMYLFNQEDAARPEQQPEPQKEQKEGLHEDAVRAALQQDDEASISDELKPEIAKHTAEDNAEQDLNKILFDRSDKKEDDSEKPAAKKYLYFDMDGESAGNDRGSNPSSSESNHRPEEEKKSYVYIEKAPEPYRAPEEVKKPEPEPVRNQHQEKLQFSFDDDQEDQDGVEGMKLIEKNDEDPISRASQELKDRVFRMNPEKDHNEDPEADRKRNIERISKLRNLSFSGGPSELNDEYETVPAYLRRNVDLRNSIASIESFYKNYTVDSDEEGGIEINTSNSFLDGKNPD